jgi:hypothetical protein
LGASADAAVWHSRVTEKDLTYISKFGTKQVGVGEISTLHNNSNQPSFLEIGTGEIGVL